VQIPGKWIVHVSDTTTVLDLDQLRSVTLDDREMMRELVSVLIEDTERQISPLESAIVSGDGPLCAQLAHYSKGACASVGANSAAWLLKEIERRARAGEFDACAASVKALATELNRLRDQAAEI
jgi:HPt (histidine-containing phosphotransfer) domain-containing protein